MPHPAPRLGWPEVEARARAAFLGVAVGDALGATTEFMTAHEVRLKYGVHRKIVGGGWLNLRAGRVTDDTEMSVFLAEAMLASEEWDLGAAAEAFVAWLRSRPIDIGATVARGIRNYMHHGALQVPPNEWDAGNGAVMRMVPVALYTTGDELLLERLAVEQAHLTHNHPLSDAGCVIVGQLVHRALLGATRDELERHVDGFIAAQPRFRFRPYLRNSSPYVADTLQTVFHFLFSTTSFEECLVGVVNQGGDADTTGAIAGMIAGALYGTEAMPRRWVRKLDRDISHRTRALATRLIRRSPLARTLRAPRAAPGA
jgi:ADP-ribosyl-[dinitrogen reductase] hydrolase